MVIILRNFFFKWTDPVSVLFFFKAPHSAYNLWNPFEALLHENCEFSFTRTIPFFGIFLENTRSIIQQTFAFTSLQKDFAFLLTDPTAQDFLDPEKSWSIQLISP